MEFPGSRRQAMKHPPLDHKDEGILDALRADPKTPHDVIAKKVNLTRPAVTRRIGKLRDRGRILNSKVVDDFGPGSPILMIVNGSLGGSLKKEQQLEEFEAAMQRNFPAVVEWLRISGEEGDYFLKIRVRTMDEFNATRAGIAELGLVTKTHLVLKAFSR